MEPKTGKRIVSKREYAKAQGIKGGLNLGRFGLLLFSILWSLLAGLYLLRLVTGMWWDVSPFLIWVACLTCGGASYLCYLTMKAVDRRIQGFEKVQPLTRANAADLPAPDSLVRASSEPMQAQEAVLLRAAAEEQERHEEQLVRAVEGPE